MTELRDLYQEVILDHYKKPRNQKRVEQADRFANGHNPLCGDKLTIALKMSGDKISEIGFQGSGCAISTASASMMTESVKGKSVPEIEILFSQFHDLVTGPMGETPKTEGLGKLAAFAGVREFPARVKCATLAWHTLKSALANKNEDVTTE